MRSLVPPIVLALLLLILVILLKACTQLPIEQQLMYETNREVIYKADTVDTWTLGCPEYGDCEDKALCLIEKMTHAGLDVSNTKLFLCYKYDQAHALVLHNGVYYDPTFNTVTSVPPCTPPYHWVNYETALIRTTNN